MKRNVFLSLLAFAFAIAGAFASNVKSSDALIAAFYKKGTTNVCTSAGDRNCVTSGTEVCTAIIDDEVETLYQSGCTVELKKP